MMSNDDYKKHSISADIKKSHVEFAEWLKNQSILIVQTPKGNEWASCINTGPRYTSEQLFDLWVEEKEVV